MTFDAGRIRHDAVLMHYSRQSNGSAAGSNWNLRATGDTGLVWMPDAGGGSVSYGSNAMDVTSADNGGASTDVSRMDHRHRGVTTVSHASNTYVGDITLQTEGGLYIVKPAANIFLLGSTGTGGGGSTTITTKDEGSTLSTTVTTLDFVGAGVTASGAGATTTVNIPGGSGALTLLSSNVLGSATADITVTGISGSYKDLVLVIKARGDTAANGIGLRLRVGNGSIDTGSNYAYARTYMGGASGNDTSASDTFLNLGFVAAASSTAGSFGSVEIELRNYISTSHWKTYSGTSWYGGNDALLTNSLGGAWKNTANAIDQVRIYVGTGNLDTGSSLYIYGRG